MPLPPVITLSERSSLPHDQVFTTHNGEASGKWSLTNKGISFVPSHEKGAMKGDFKLLYVSKFKGDWALLPTDNPKVLGEYGISPFRRFLKPAQLK